MLTTLTARSTEGEGVKMTTYVAPIQQRVRYWQKFLSQKYPLLAKAAVRLIVLHVTLLVRAQLVCVGQRVRQGPQPPSNQEG
jgi:hypothetical protein